jgi:hypothetical protein
MDKMGVVCYTLFMETYDNYIKIIGTDENIGVDYLELVVKTSTGLIMLVLRLNMRYLLAKQFRDSIIYKLKPLHVEVDEDGSMVDGLSKLQENICELYVIIKEMQKLETSLFGRYFAIPFILNRIKKTHSVYESLRISIMEHDADCSPTSKDGPFNNTDDLIKSLLS